MIRTVAFGERNLLKVVQPSELMKMNDNTMVAVNRVCVNRQLLKIRKSSSADLDAQRILIEALKSTRQRERKRSGSIATVTISVGDLKKAFKHFDELPNNSIRVVSVGKLLK